MAKEWILNQAMNRWGLNKKRSVGPVSELIRKCAPKKLEDWENFYYKEVYTQEYLAELGKRLFVKISEIVQYEVAEVTEQDCISYIKEVVINRTYQGYQTEIQTVYGQLQSILGVPIKPAPDEWDRLYAVDFFTEIKHQFVGFQIKPITFEHTFEEHKWKSMQENAHHKFQEKFGGRVFTIYSIKSGQKKIIKNIDVIEEIKQEIHRLMK